jgi:3-methylcrotonyl-CoA carboxylase beta subunit
MTILRSAVDAAAPAFSANAARMEALVAQLRQRTALAALGGPQEARDRHVARGKLLPRERVMGLLDRPTECMTATPMAQG